MGKHDEPSIRLSDVSLRELVTILEVLHEKVADGPGETAEVEAVRNKLAAVLDTECRLRGFDIQSVLDGVELGEPLHPVVSLGFELDRLSAQYKSEDEDAAQLFAGLRSTLADFVAARAESERGGGHGKSWKPGDDPRDVDLTRMNQEEVRVWLAAAAGDAERFPEECGKAWPQLYKYACEVLRQLYES